MQNLAPLEPASPKRLQRATASARTVNKSLRLRPKKVESRYLLRDRLRFGRRRAFLQKTRKRSQLNGFRGPPRLCLPNSTHKPADKASYQQSEMRDDFERGIDPRNQPVTSKRRSRKHKRKQNARCKQPRRDAPVEATQGHKRGHGNGET